MNNNMKQYQHKGWKVLTMLLAMCLAFAGTSFLTACSSQDDPYYTVSEDDVPRILNNDDLSDKTIRRDEPFQMEVKATPRIHSTVTWVLNGTPVATGHTINQLLPVGTHDMQILITTVHGKTTYRNIKVTVLPLDTDPTIASDGRSRWLQIGTTKTVDCENVTSVSKLLIGDVEAKNVSYANKKLTFEIPATMAEGNYLVTLVDAEGTKWGCGLFTVSNDPYVDPGIKETVLWEGDFVLDWSDGEGVHKEWREVPQEVFAELPTGQTLVVSLRAAGADYNKAQFDDWSWAPLPVETPIVEGMEDIDVSFTITQELLDAVAAQAFCIHGHGYAVMKMKLVEGVAPAVTTLWEGAITLDWSDGEGVQKEWREISQEDFATLEIGHILHVSLIAAGADYNKAQFDDWSWAPLPIETPIVEGMEDIVVDIEITQALKDAVAAQAFCIHGHGYKVVKVTYE